MNLYFFFKIRNYILLFCDIHFEFVILRNQVKNMFKKPSRTVQDCLCIYNTNVI